jgi:hypothetical protein
MAMGERTRVPRYQTSRGFWNRPKREPRPTGKGRDTDPQSYAERVKDCGTTSNVFETCEAIDTGTGEVINGRAWRMRVDLNEETLRLLAPHVASGRVRIKLAAPSVRALIEALQLAVGQPITVVSGFAGGGGLG